jgi:hypothetical protein
MSIFTKAERHRIYKNALQLLLRKIQSQCETALCCDCIYISAYTIYRQNIRVTDFPVFFPEFSSQRPAGVSYADVWFPLTENGNKQRIELLTKIIEETKP